MFYLRVLRVHKGLLAPQVHLVRLSPPVQTQTAMPGQTATPWKAVTHTGILVEIAMMQTPTGILVATTAEREQRVHTEASG